MKPYSKICYLILFLFAQIPSQYILAEEIPKKTSEASFIFQKFGITMGLVILCLILLIGILTFYKKYFLNNIQPKDSNASDMSLEAPKNLEQALKSFFERTRSNR